MKLSFSVFLASLVAAWTLADATSLREDLVGLLSEELEADTEVDLDEELELEAELGLPKRCRLKRYRGKKYVDKECEKTQTSAPACSCRETCKIWGDPYTAPFYSECFVKTFKQPKHTYTIWNVPGAGRWREELNIEAYVDTGSFLGGHYATSSREWVMKVLINDNEIASAKDCAAYNIAHDSLLTRREFEMFSDVALKTSIPYEDVKVEVEVFCRRSNDRTRTPHLAVMIKTIDFGSRYNIYGELDRNGQSATSFWENTDTGSGTTRSGTKKSGSISRSWSTPTYVPPDTTHYFDNDFGVCTNPVKYGDATPYQEDAADVDERLTCRKNSNSNKEVDVRECTCSTQCAMFGDPFVWSFFDPHFPKPKRGKKKRKRIRPFKLDKKANLQPFEHSLYSFWDHITVDISLDDCERIDKVMIRSLKPQYLERPCQELDSKFSKPTWQYDEYVIDAATACTSTDPLTATKIVYPPKFSDGLPLGLVAMNSNGQLVRLQREEDISADVCQQSVRDLNSFVNLGSLRIIAKCHARRDGTPFFNICVQREEAVRKFYVKKDKVIDPQEIKDITKYDPKAWNALQTLERDTKSGGWCALGGYDKATMSRDKIDRDHKYRKNADIERFPHQRFTYD